jgi:hypothetical protein
MISEKQVKVVRQEQIDPVQSLFYKMRNWRYAVEKLDRIFKNEP